MPHETDLHLSTARTVASISVIATFGSIVTGLVQLRRQVTGSWIPGEVVSRTDTVLQKIYVL